MSSWETLFHTPIVTVMAPGITLSHERWFWLLTHQQTAWSLLRLSLWLHHSGTEHQATAVLSNYLWTLYHMFFRRCRLSRWTMMYSKRDCSMAAPQLRQITLINRYDGSLQNGTNVLSHTNRPICTLWDSATTSNRTHLGGGRSSERKMWHGFLSAWNAGPPFSTRHCLDHSLCSASSFRW